MNVLRWSWVLPAALLTACTASKSSTPLSPSVAGPIGGVTITAPRPLLPASGARLTRDAHPVVLAVANATTNGERSLTYVYEVGLDAGLASPTFQKSGVTPGANGQTTVELPGPLEAGRTYYWRARAGDGANTSPHSDVAHFIVYEPFILSAPSPMSPIGGITIGSNQATLRTSNASRAGPSESVSYEFEVSLVNGFDPLAAGGVVSEGAGETALTVGLDASRTYLWRVRAFSASATSPWSAIQTFKTPANPTPAPPPPGPGGLPPSNPGPRPGAAEGVAMIEAVIKDMRARGISTSGDCGAFAITKRVAWAFQNRGAGLERKPGGRNCESRSIDILIFTDGQTVDILVGAGDDNGPSWQEHGVLSDWRDWWVAPTNPN